MENQQGQNGHNEYVQQQNATEEQIKEPKGFVKIKTSLFWSLLIILVCSTALFTIVVTSQYMRGQTETNSGKLTSDNLTDMDKIQNAFAEIQERYYQKTDDDKLVNGAIKGMVDSLEDPYSEYMSQEEAKAFNEVISSSFEGIGAEINEVDGKIIIVAPIKGSPAEKSGIKAGDEIIKVGDKSLQGMSSTDAVKLIRGEKGTPVTLEILHSGETEPTQITIIRDTIPIETVHSEMLDGKIAHISVSSFSENTAKELTTELEKMEDQGMKGLVLDVRGNPGGLLETAIEIADQFVPKGEIIAQQEDKQGKKTAYRATGNNGYKVKVPIAVLIDNGSASASEVVAAALKESANAEIVGVKSFGKGTMQTAEMLADGSNMKLTVGKWLTPKGNWVHKEGITPDKVVELPTYSSVTYIDPKEELKKGSYSTDTKSAEEMLTALDYHAGNIDGYFDEQTEAGVKEFQTAANLPVTGVVAGDTTTKLMEQVRDKIKANDTQLNAAVEAVK